MSDEIVLVERRGAVGVITMNRPKQLNALSDELMAALGDALDRARRRRRDPGGGGHRQRAGRSPPARTSPRWPRPPPSTS